MIQKSFPSFLIGARRFLLVPVVSYWCPSFLIGAWELFQVVTYSFSLIVMRTLKLFHTYITPLRSEKVDGVNLISATPPNATL